ncbi:hypothetical protein ACN47E_004754 [Coniothyrium glycines]
MPQHCIKHISLSTFKDVLSRYSSIVPEKLKELDTLRFETLPATAAKRGVSEGLSKGELEQLMSWKLQHGTFRPKLMALVQQNSAEDVEKVTQKAAALITKQKDVTDLSALKTLVELRGVGPATASLVLSVMQPESNPFFSDEIFRWACWDEPGSPGGWQRKIKYNVNEYALIVKKIEQLRKRLGTGDVTALDAERVAWVLGKEGIDIGENDAVELSEEAATEEPKEPGKRLGKAVAAASAEGEDKKTTKRKAAESKAPAEGVRKSARTKK